MNDDLISKPPIQDVSSSDPNPDGPDNESPNIQVFDITPDLNISPAKDEIESPSDIPISKDIVKDLDKQINLATPVAVPKPTDIPTPVVVPITATKPTETIKQNVTAPIQNTVPTPTQIAEPTPVAVPVTKQNTSSTPNVSSTSFAPPTTLVEPTAPVTPIATPSQSFGPANPPAKTIGVNKLTFTKVSEEKVIPTPTNTSLQDAVAGITEQTKASEKPVEIKNDPNVKPIRTYESDIAEAMAKKRLSTASIVIAEDNRKQAAKVENVIVKTDEKNIPQGITESKMTSVQEEVIPNHSIRNWLLGIISLMLICGGTYAGYYIYSQSPLATSKKPSTIVIDNLPGSSTTTPIKNITNTKTPEPTFSKSLIRSDSKTVIKIDGASKSKILSLIQSEVSANQTSKTIKEIIISETIGTELERVSSSKIMALAELSAPEIFNRSLSADWMLGTYANSNGQNNIFVIAKNDFFQNSFAGMIQWEKTMPEDLREYLVPSNTSTNFTLRGQYKDRIIRNKDVREYVTDDGRIIFLYSFISNDKVVITNNEEALGEIIDRLEKNAFVR